MTRLQAEKTGLTAVLRSFALDWKALVAGSGFRGRSGRISRASPHHSDTETPSARLQSQSAGSSAGLFEARFSQRYTIVLFQAAQLTPLIRLQNRKSNYRWGLKIGGVLKSTTWCTDGSFVLVIIAVEVGAQTRILRQRNAFNAAANRQM